MVQVAEQVEVKPEPIVVETKVEQPVKKVVTQPKKKSNSVEFTKEELLRRLRGL